MKARKNDSESGFTLIEVIITLVVVAVVAAMMAAYFGTSFTKSSLPIFRLQSAGKLNRIMEKITSDYNSEPATWSPGTAYATTNNILGPTRPTFILPTEANRNGYRYICTAGGTSGTAEPAWPTSGTVTDGTVQWTYGGSTPPMNWIASKAYPLNAIVYPTNGYMYQCTAVGTSGTGISGATVPTWRTDSTPFTDGTGSTQIQWTYKGPQPTVALQTKIGAEVAGGQDYTKTFGGVSISYRVIQNRFINFVGNTENGPITAGDPDYGKYLKVTIGLHSTEVPRTDETLTTLFVRR